MPTYYVQWHMRQALVPMLFDEDDPAPLTAAAQARTSAVAPAERSPSAKRKASTQRTDQDQPVYSFQSLLKDLATICRNTLQFGKIADATFIRITTPTPVQRRALELLGLSL